MSRSQRLRVKPFAVGGLLAVKSRSIPARVAYPSLHWLNRLLRCATSGASITGAIRNIRGTHRSAAQIMNNGFRIMCSLCYSNPENCSARGSLCQPLCDKKVARISLKLNSLDSEMASRTCSTIASLAPGSAKLAVPTCTAEAPTAMYSSTSTPVSMPPRPIMGMLTA